MPKILLILVFLTGVATKSFTQKLDSIMLTSSDIPEGYSLTDENNCISIQACIFYNKPELYASLIGKLKNKRIQNFNNKKDAGSIMYFEFENEFQHVGFLEGLLWGEGRKPTKDHPEIYYAKEKFLIIWSFKKGSAFTKHSSEKIIALLK